MSAVSVYADVVQNVEHFNAVFVKSFIYGIANDELAEMQELFVTAYAGGYKGK